MSSYPIFPKIGDHVKFDEVYCVYDFFSQTQRDIVPGTIAEVLKTEIISGNQEITSYNIYLGLLDNYVVRMDYSVHAEKITIIPNTPAGQVLYGNK